MKNVDKRPTTTSDFKGMTLKRPLARLLDSATNEIEAFQIQPIKTRCATRENESTNNVL